MPSRPESLMYSPQRCLPFTGRAQFLVPARCRGHAGSCRPRVSFGTLPAGGRGTLTDEHAPGDRSEAAPLPRGAGKPYAVVIEPYEFRVEMYAKRSNWQVALVTRPDDLIGMPEFGPSCRV